MRTQQNSGFSLMELLTVVTLIAIITAMMFPVFSGMKRHTTEGKCMTNLHSIWAAVRQYRQDEGHFPESLLVREQRLVNGTTVDQLGGLYPVYIRSLRYFSCSNSDTVDKNFPMDGTDRDPSLPVDFRLPNGTTIQEIPLSSYENLSTFNGAKWVTTEVHYQRNWTWANKIADPTEDDDYRRQLIQRYPPDNTVIAVCPYHRGGSDFSILKAPNVVDRNKREIILWFDGSAKAIEYGTIVSQLPPTLPASQIWHNLWRIKRPQN